MRTPFACVKPDSRRSDSAGFLYLKYTAAFSERQLFSLLNAAAQEVGPLLTWYLLTESHTRPAIFLGTSSDRIGSPKGTQSYYLTAAKHLFGMSGSAWRCR